MCAIYKPKQIVLVHGESKNDLKLRIIVRKSTKFREGNGHVIKASFPLIIKATTLCFLAMSDSLPFPHFVSIL